MIAHKIWRLSLLVFFIGMVLLPSASSQSLPDERRVTVDFVDIPLDSALLLLSYHSGVSIGFNPDIIPKERQVTLSANRLMLGLALDNILVNTDLKYGIVGSQIAIQKRQVIEAPKMVTIDGYLRDAQTGENLIFGHIATKDGSHGVTSNEYGYYSLALPSDAYHLLYSYVGYEDAILDVRLLRDTTIDISLNPRALLKEIVITGEVKKEFKKSEESDQMPLEILSSMATLAGESDVIRLAQTRAGVTSQADGFGGLNVRGGSADQNLILYDGVPVYNTGHALGLFSVFNSSAIKSAELIKGGFPARFGGRLSSIYDIRTKEGNNQRTAGEAGISPLMIKGTIEGPIAKSKSSYILSGRRTIIDPWLRPLSRYQFERNDEEGQINFFFYDLNAKINYVIGDNNQIFLSAYKGGDKYANEVLGVIETDIGITEELDETDINWGNEVITLRWASRINRKLFGVASVSSTTFNFDNFDFNRVQVNGVQGNVSKTYVSRLYSSNISDYIGTYDLNWYVHPKYFVKVGGNYARHSFQPGSDATAILRNASINPLINEEDRISITTIKDNRDFEEINGNELRLYLENDIRIGREFSANVGVHWSSISTERKTYRSWQPRISAQLKVTPWLQLRAGYSEMDQYFHLLSSASLGLPSDVWLPSTDQLSPETSRQWSASVTADLGPDMTFKLGAFDKVFDNLTGYAQGASLDISGSTDWQQEVPVGSGSARGVEIELSKRVGVFRGWAAYTFSESLRTFATINGGRTFYADNDRRHQLHLMTLTTINDNMEFSAGWTFGSGLPATFPSSTDPTQVDGQILYIPIISEINGERLPDYHKLDVSFNIFNAYDWGKQKLTIGAYNAYGKRNPYFVEVVLDESGEKFNFEQISVLPFVPYVGFTLTF